MQDLIDLTDIEFQEPATTQHLSDAEIFSLTQKDSLCEIPDLASHSQSVERSVKLVCNSLHQCFSNCVRFSNTVVCRERFLSVQRNFLEYINPCFATAT